MQKEKIQRLVLTAVLIAMSAVLSMVKVFEMPLGGSITLFSMLPIALVSIKYGCRWGLFASSVYVLVQTFLDLGKLMSWSMTLPIWIGCLVFDYILAFGSLGMAGIFRNKGVTGIVSGIGVALGMRFLSHVISGTIFFASWCPEGWNPFLYSICYNGAYMLPELALTMVGAVLLCRTSVFKKISVPQA